MVKWKKKQLIERQYKSDDSINRHRNDNRILLTFQYLSTMTTANTKDASAAERSEETRSNKNGGEIPWSKQKRKQIDW